MEQNGVHVSSEYQPERNEECYARLHWMQRMKFLTLACSKNINPEIKSREIWMETYLENRLFKTINTKNHLTL